MISKRAVTWLIVIALVLPIALTVTFGLANLLGAMSSEANDPWVATLYRVCLVGGTLWVVNLICLQIVVALYAVQRQEGPHDRPAD